MNKPESLGIWMDHSNANLIEWTTPAMTTTTVKSKFTHRDKEHSLGESEKLMHNKEQHEQAQFYKSLKEVIRDYKEVLLFGPTEAKVELFNLLSSDPAFSKIRIQIRPADKMTDNEQHAFVRNHFSKRLHI